MFQRIKKFINPAPRVGGLEIYGHGLRYFSDAKSVVQASVPLEDGIIVDGVIRDRGRLAAALRSLKLHIPKARQVEHVVAVMPAHQPKTEVVSTPRLSGKQLDEAKTLALAVGDGLIADLMPLTVVDAAVDKLDFLTASAPAASVAEFTGALQEAGFNPVAVEFPALAIARFVREKGSGLDFSQPKVVVDFGADGINSFLLIDGKLYGQEFLSWGAVQQSVSGHQIAAAEIKPVIINALKKLVLSAGRFGAQPQELILIAPPTLSGLMADAQKSFSLQLRSLVIAGEPIASVWLAAAGAALRGPSKEISLGGDTASYQNDRWLGFARRWRGILVVSALGALVLLGLGEAVLISQHGALEKKLAEVRQAPGGSEFVALSAEAARFNQLVELAGRADAEHRDMAGFLRKLIEIGKANRITYEKISVSEDQKVAIGALASTEGAAAEFKNQLAAEPNFQNVVLPLSDIATSTGGVRFSTSLEVSSFDF